jgi:hypothetical protein
MKILQMADLPYFLEILWRKKNYLKVFLKVLVQKSLETLPTKLNALKIN